MCPACPWRRPDAWIPQPTAVVFDAAFLVMDAADNVAAVRGKVADWRSSIEIGGVRIAPAALIFGDLDGIVVIPSRPSRRPRPRPGEGARREPVSRLAGVM